MAVLQGARLRTSTVPAARSSVERRSVARPRAASVATTTLGSGHRVRPMGLLMAAIVITTMLGMVYLTQTLGANASTSAVGRLEAEREDVRTVAERQDLRILRYSTDDTIKPEARQLGLRELPRPIVLEAP